MTEQMFASTARAGTPAGSGAVNDRGMRPGQHSSVGVDAHDDGDAANIAGTGTGTGAGVAAAAVAGQPQRTLQ